MWNSRAARAALRSSFLLAVATAACAPGYRSAASPAPRGRVADVGLRALEGQALAREAHRSLYDVLASYWPNVETPPWQLRAPVRELDRVGVYDGTGAYVGGIDQLRAVTAARVTRVRRMTPSEEYLRFGRQHAAGALIVEWADARRR